MGSFSAASWEAWQPQAAQSSRGCGGGIGLPEHITSYSYGVLSGHNWVEEKHAFENGNPPPMEMGHLSPPPHLATTSRASYRPDGKVGAELLENTGLGAAEEIKFERRGVPKEALFGHYPAMTEQTKSFVSCHDLHYAEPHIGKPRAQAGLWAYSTSHNVKVPMSRPENIAGGTLALTRTRTLDRSEPYDPFLTTSQATLGATAHAITDGGAERRAPIVQDGAKEGGQRAQVGRKPAGYFSSLADSRSRRPPLRT